MLKLLDELARQVLPFYTWRPLFPAQLSTVLFFCSELDGYFDLLFGAGDLHSVGRREYPKAETSSAKTSYGSKTAGATSASKAGQQSLLFPRHREKQTIV